METLNCLNCAQSGIGQAVVFVNGAPKCCCCQTINPATITPRTYGESKGAYIDRAFAAEATLEPTPEPIEVAPVAAKVARRGGRCPVYAIRVFMARAKEAGCDLKNTEGRRREIARYLGLRALATCSDLTPAQWSRAAFGVKLGEIRF